MYMRKKRKSENKKELLYSLFLSIVGGELMRKKGNKKCDCNHHKDGWINHIMDCPNEDQYDIWEEEE